MVNRSVTWADWDEELLALELQEIQEADFDLSLTGFDNEPARLLAAQDVAEGLTDEDSVPKLPQTPVGDLWILGNHKLLVVAGKTIEEVVIEARTPGICVGVGPHQLSVSFEQGTAIDFTPAGARPPTTDGSAFAAAPAELDPFPGNRGAEPRSGDPLSGRYLVWVSPSNTVKFLGKPFDAVDDTSAASLLIDAEALDHVVKQRKVLPGLRLSTR